MHDLKVSTAEFIKNFGQLSDKALSVPVTVTKNGRDRLVVLSVDEYDRLKRRDRRVYLTQELPDYLAQELPRTDDVPPESVAVNDEAKDWKL